MIIRCHKRLLSLTERDRGQWACMLVYIYIYPLNNNRRVAHIHTYVHTDTRVRRRFMYIYASLAFPLPHIARRRKTRAFVVLVYDTLAMNRDIEVYPFRCVKNPDRDYLCAVIANLVSPRLSHVTVPLIINSPFFISASCRDLPSLLFHLCPLSAFLFLFILSYDLFVSTSTFCLPLKR